MEKELHLAADYCADTGVYRRGNPPQFAAGTELSFPEYIFPRMLLPGRRAHPAFVDASTGKALSFGELRALSLRVARALSAAGLRHGHVALLLSPNSLHFPALSLAVLSLGAVLSAANPLLTPDELARQADDAKPFLVLVTGDLAPKLRSVAPAVKRVLIEQLLADVAKAKVDDDHGETLDLPAANIGREDAALLFYSSGTTGRSKGVVSTHGNAIAVAASLERAWGGGGEKPQQYDDEVYGCVLPMFHMFGFSSFVMGTAALGATAVVVPGRFSVEKTMAAVEEYEVTRLLVVPPMVVKMVRAATGESTSSRGRRLRLRQVVSSGAPLQREHMARFRSCFPAVKLGQCYGLTEMTGIVTMCDLQHDDNGVDGVEVPPSSTEVKVAAIATMTTTTEAKERNTGGTGGGGVSIGWLMPGVEAKIVDPDSDEPLPPHRTGELWVRSPSTMRGYLNNEEATTMTLVAAVSSSDGGDDGRWLRTGDLCYVDSRGLVYMVDRMKELIKGNAYQVAPAELEDILATHPDIHDAAIAAYPDKEASEIPMACVVKKQGSGHLQEDEVISFVQNKVAPYKKIRRVVFVDSIPRSPSGKILRRQLKNLLQGSILHRSRM